MNLHRLVQTEAGEIEYLLVKKRIKNLNLRIRDDGSVHLSVPLVCTVSQADAFIARGGRIPAPIHSLKN